MNQEAIISLLQKFLDQTLSWEEGALLREWVQGEDRSSIETVMKEYEAMVMKAKAGRADPLLFRRIKDAIEEKEWKDNAPERVPVIHMKPKRRLLWRGIAAAVILCLFSAAAYFIVIHNKQSATQLATVKDIPAPKRSKAVIILSNGIQIVPDSMAGGTLATQASVKIMKTAGGDISYEDSLHDGVAGNTIIAYNTLNNPRGSDVVSLMLSDGSKVWLNAASSLRYPVSFTGKERRVEVTGEAYFEVAHNSSIPFVVSKGEMQVQVTGTHFNVNAYEDEPEVRVTLLEGHVRVITPGSRLELEPGQQAAGTAGGALVLTKNINTDQVMAWKNGLFSLDKTSIASFMRMVSRWYDVDVVYEAGIPRGTISGEVQRSLSFDQMQKVLQLTDVHFRVEGRKVIVN